MVLTLYLVLCAVCEQLARGHLTSVLHSVWSLAITAWSLISSSAVRIRSCLFSMEAHVLQIDWTRLPGVEVSAKAALTLSPSSSSSPPIILLPFPPSLALFPPHRTANNESSVTINLLTCSPSSVVLFLTHLLLLPPPYNNIIAGWVLSLDPSLISLGSFETCLWPWILG